MKFCCRSHGQKLGRDNLYFKKFLCYKKATFADIKTIFKESKTVIYQKATCTLFFDITKIANF